MLHIEHHHGNPRGRSTFYKQQLLFPVVYKNSDENKSQAWGNFLLKQSAINLPLEARNVWSIISLEKIFLVVNTLESGTILVREI